MAEVGKQTVRQQARRAALGVQAQRRAQRVERDRRLEALAVAVLTAMGERDAAIGEADRRAGEALAAMTEDEGLTLREAVDWCGDQVTVHEAMRLRRLGKDRPAPGNGATGGGAKPEASV
jgi:hypothetical protein